MNTFSNGTPNSVQIYDQLVSNLMGSDTMINVNSMSDAERAKYATADKMIRNTYDQVTNFLVQSGMVSRTTQFGNGSVVGVESFNPNASVAGVSRASINMLMDSADVPASARPEVTKQICAMLARCQACAGNNALYRSTHFNQSVTDNEVRNAINRCTTTVFAPSLLGTINNIGMPSEEAFGVNIDKVIADLPAALTVTLLQAHRSILDRIVHRRTSASPYVRYVVPYAEVYDMLKSNDADHNVRDEGDHRVPFINLYADPKSVSNQLQPIVPLTANDVNSDLVGDGIIKFGREVNLFDLSKLANQIGKSQYNYTDLVSENVIFDSAIVSLTSGGTTENFQIDLSHVQMAKYQMQPNTADSGDRACMFRYAFPLKKNTLTVTGAPSTILANCTDTDFLRLEIHVSSQISLKTSNVYAMCEPRVTAYNSVGSEVASDVSNLLKGLSVAAVGYSVDARYSEENLRKSNLAIRYHTRPFSFEISNGRNILVDYSMQEELPEFLMSLVTEATALGQDHRGLDVIIREMLYVYDRANMEKLNPDFRNRIDKIGFQYVSSQIVRPMVYLNSIDLNNVDTIRSSDILGDIRQYVEWQLLNLISLLYQNTYYKHQLKPGEIPTFKVLTSSVILENLFNVPHIHDHLNKDQPVDGSTVEYRRVLPNGTVLDMVTTTFDVMRNKIVMIPWRENDPEDVLNFGHNWDYGTFIAHYNPQLDNAVNKRVFSNSRTMVIPTNPMGLYLDVKGMDKFINMFSTLEYDVTGAKASKLPEPADLEIKDI